MNGHREFSLSEKERIVELRLAATSWEDIARDMRRGRRPIQNVIRNDPFFEPYRNNSKFRPGIGLSADDRDQLRYMVEVEKLSTHVIGSRLGITSSAVQKRMMRWSIKSPYHAPGKKVGTPITPEDEALALSYLQEGYSYNQAGIFTGHTGVAIARHIPGFEDNAKIAQSIRMVEKHGMRKVDEVWGLKNAA